MKLFEHLSRHILKRIHKRTQISYAIESSGISYRPAGRTTRFLSFDTLISAILHRRDIYTTDIIVLTLAFEDGTIIEFFEDDPQWSRLVTTLDEAGITAQPSRIWLAQAIADKSGTARDLLKA